MNWMTLIGLIPEIISAAPKIKSIIDAGGSVLTVIEEEAPIVGTLISDIGANLFPKVAPELQAIAAITTTFDPNVTTWLQKALNAYDNAGLTVDGKYGPATVAAVEAAQTKLGVSVDGWAGQITMAALQLAVQNVPPLTSSQPVIPAAVAATLSVKS